MPSGLSYYATLGALLPLTCYHVEGTTLACYGTAALQSHNLALETFHRDSAPETTGEVDNMQTPIRIGSESVTEI